MERLREGDEFLGDAHGLSAHKSSITQGLWALGVHRVSELYNTFGDRRVQLTDGK